VDEGVDRMMVVTTIVLPFETERNVDGENEGPRVVVGVVVEVERVEGVVDGGEVEVVEVEDDSEVDGGRDVEVLPGVLGGGGVLLGEGTTITLEVATELEGGGGTWFQVLFHSPSGVLFTFPSRY